MSDSIDALIQERGRKSRELANIGDKIKENSHDIVVIFVDLCDSTEIKGKFEDETWLGYIYEFLQLVTKLANDNNGTVVKRIGDELMITFETVEKSENFLDKLNQNEELNNYKYKIGCDYGSTYYLKFESNLENDPYGTVVDRCSRIISKATANTILCSEDYFRNVSDDNMYLSLGKFNLKGLDKLNEIYIRQTETNEEYLEPLIESLNKRENKIDSYLYTSRIFDSAYFNKITSREARGFVARELINVPKLPYAADEFYDMYKELDNPDKEKEFIGYLVEWQGEFSSYSRESDYIFLL